MYYLINFVLKEGIIHKLTLSYSCESNGVIERKNKILKEMINDILISFGAPDNLFNDYYVIFSFLS